MLRSLKKLVSICAAGLVLTCASITHAEVPPLFDDARGHGQFMENFEFALDSSRRGYVTAGASGTDDPRQWVINTTANVHVVVKDDDNGSVNALAIFGDRREVPQVFDVIRKMLNINYSTDSTRQQVNLAFGKIGLDRCDGVPVNATFTDDDTGRRFVIGYQPYQHYVILVLARIDGE